MPIFRFADNRDNQKELEQDLIKRYHDDLDEQVGDFSPIIHLQGAEPSLR